MADFAPSELNLDERRVRNIVMEKAMLKQYGKSIDDVYNDYFKPAIAAYVEYVKKGYNPESVELVHALREKTTEINKAFIVELGKYMYQIGEYRNTKFYSQLGKLNYDIITMCECCHFHTFYTSIFKKLNKDNNRFKVYRINFQLANIGESHKLVYIDNKYVPMSNETILEIHNYTKHVFERVIVGNVTNRNSKKHIKTQLANSVKHVTTSNCQSEGLKLSVHVDELGSKHKYKQVSVCLSRPNTDGGSTKELSVPVLVCNLQGESR